MLKDVALLQVRVNGISGRSQQLTRGDAKMTIPGMAASQMHQPWEPSRSPHPLAFRAGKPYLRCRKA